MANWSKPTLPDPYPDFLDSLVARDLDTGTLFLVDPTNPPVGVIRYNRTENLFQEWNGSSWVNKVISQPGGGTGAGSLPALGTMASQNANNVNISGGNMQGMTTVYANGELRSATHLRINGQLISGSSQIVLTDSVGKIPAINTNYFTNANVDAGLIGTGTVNGNRLGTGYAGGGTKVLLDNGTWASVDVVGGMFDQVHNDAAFGTGEMDKTVTISWNKGNPSHYYKVSFQVHSNGAVNSSAPGAGSMAWIFQWKVTGVNTALISRIPTGGNAPAGAYTVPWTASHHIINGF